MAGPRLVRVAVKALPRATRALRERRRTAEPTRVLAVRLQSVVRAQRAAQPARVAQKLRAAQPAQVVRRPRAAQRALVVQRPRAARLAQVARRQRAGRPVLAAAL